jgi:dienelactone hydrolase
VQYSVGIALAIWLLVVGRAQDVLAQAPDVAWTPIPTPPGFEAPDIDWVAIAGPDGHRFNAAVLQPAGSRRSAVVIVLHGGSGLAGPSIEVGRQFRDAGFLAVVPCWFNAPGGPPRQVDCSDAPQSDVAAVRALVDSTGRLPGGDAERIGFYGLSTGGGMAALVASSGADVRAVVSDAGTLVSFRTNALGSVKNLGAPLLILQGEDDQQVSPKQAREYEQAARDLGKLVEAHYYPRVGHVVILPGSSPPELRNEVTSDALARSTAFFAKHLGVSADSTPSRLPSAGEGPQLPLHAVVIGAIGIAMLVAGWNLRHHAR